MFKNDELDVEDVEAEAICPFFSTCLRIFATVNGWRATVSTEYITVPDGGRYWGLGVRVKV